MGEGQQGMRPPGEGWPIMPGYHLPSPHPGGEGTHETQMFSRFSWGAGRTYARLNFRRIAKKIKAV